MDENHSSTENDEDDSKLLDSLLEMEKKLDEMIVSKKLEIQQWVSVPLRYKCKIRITVSPFFYVPQHCVLPTFELPIENSASLNLSTLPSVEFRVEGKIIDASCISAGSSLYSGVDISKISRKFLSFFKSIFIELDSKIYGKELRLVEWSNTKKATEYDGFVIRKPVFSVDDINGTIILSPLLLPQQYTLSPGLASIIGSKVQSKAQVISCMWKYITNNNLLDTYQRDVVHCDACLKQLFGCDQFMLPDISDMLTPHLHLPDPHIVTFVAKNPLAGLSYFTPGCVASPPNFFDIEIEVNDINKDSSQNYMIHFNNNVISMDLTELQSLEQQARLLSEQLDVMKEKYKNYQEYASNPSAYINNWLKQKSFDNSNTQTSNQEQKPLSTNEDERSSDYFCKPWINEFVHRYLFNMVQAKTFELNKSFNDS